MPQPFKLSPSELTFLWDECPRCFYLKVVRGYNRPAAPFPKIFTRIDGLMKDFFAGRSPSEFSPSLPAGVIQSSGRMVTSQPVSFPGRAAACFLKGKFDTVIAFADGSYGVVDFKTSESRPEHVAFYSRQLHAYAYALEHPAAGSLRLAPVSRLGLLCVEPSQMQRTESGQIAYLGAATWLECPLDEGGFLGFLESVLKVLEQPAPPAAHPQCAYCRYRDQARDSGL